MLWGSALAIVMRLVLTFLVSYLLLLPGLRFLGAVLLAYIACKLIQEESESAGHVHETQTNMRAAIARIALADLVMSLDNVIAIAGVSQSEPVRLVDRPHPLDHHDLDAEHVDRGHHEPLSLGRLRGGRNPGSHRGRHDGA